MREKREKRAGRGPSSRAPRVSLAPKTPFPFPFIRLPRRLDQTVKKLIAFRSRKFIACHSKLSILNNAGVMWCAKESRMRVLMIQGDIDRQFFAAVWLGLRTGTTEKMPKKEPIRFSSHHFWLFSLSTIFTLCLIYIRWSHVWNINSTKLR